MVEFDAIILAAGLSSRMGDANKLTLDVGGMPLIARTVAVYCRVIPGEVIVVTGYQRDEVEASLAGLPVTFVHNPSYASGQQSSVVAGLKCASHATATVVGLGDQPRLTGEDLTWLMEAHRASPEQITIPVGLGKRGNPIVVPNTLRDAVLNAEDAPGCRMFTRRNSDKVRKVETARDGFFFDIDTPEDYETLKAMQGGAHALVR